MTQEMNCPKCGQPIVENINSVGATEYVCCAYGFGCDYKVPNVPEDELTVTKEEPTKHECEAMKRLGKELSVKSCYDPNTKQTVYYCQCCGETLTTEEATVKTATPCSDCQVSSKVTSTTAVQKPIGVMPRELWEQERMHDLSRAIHAYIDFGDLAPAKEWTKELLELLNKVGE